MKSLLKILVCLVIVFVGLCKPETGEINYSEQSNNPNVPINTEVVLNKGFKPVMGQTVYVPIYSHIYYLRKRKVYNLAATISIHNIDLNNSIVLKFVKYYDTNGTFLNDYISKPVKLGPLASTDFFIEQHDTRGGVGANFLIEWVSETKVSPPIVESVMLGTAGTQGVSFLSTGRVIKEFKPAK
ncbi:MAG: DUF3124 domain-containing protein [Leptospiraceae bacterium]|nr:DUF3124 domain-containing protein [Leptospiraceae bacterium]MCP5493393.1 DUF3124 domain-containing protein [Leptospiraceae bacterium]